MKQIIIQDTLSIENCQINPTHLYVFGDNSIRKGKGGQAIIRDCINTFGIVTKNRPGWDYRDYFRDNESEKSLMMHDVYQLRDIYYSTYNQFTHIVFPRGGLGTGLAKMPEYAPETFGLLCRSLKDIFDLEMDKNGFKLK